MIKPRLRVLLKSMSLVALVLAGTMGYWLIEEQYDLFDALYMTVITLSTIGYGEIHELSRAGRAFTILLVLGGVSTFAYVITEFISRVASGELRDYLDKQHMAQQLAQMKNHIIVCGYGRVGRLVCQEFVKEKTPFVVIDLHAEELQGFGPEHGIPLVGDANSDDVLRQAGIERARGLVTVMASDADNLFVTMSARLLNAKLYIVARMQDAQSEQKLLRAGANRIVSPYHIGGRSVAQAILRPTVVDFIELATGAEHLEIQIEESKISDQSALAGRTIHESHIRDNLKVIVVAIKKRAGKMQFNPEANTRMEAGDILVAMGSPEQLERLDELANRGAAT